MTVTSNSVPRAPSRANTVLMSKRPCSETNSRPMRRKIELESVSSVVVLGESVSVRSVPGSASRRRIAVTCAPVMMRSPKHSGMPLRPGVAVPPRSTDICFRSTSSRFSSSTLMPSTRPAGSPHVGSGTTANAIGTDAVTAAAIEPFESHRGAFFRAKSGHRFISGPAR